MTQKLRPVQLIAMVLCARVFTVMTCYPSAYGNAPVYMIGLAWSGALQLLIMLPVILLVKYFPGNDSCTLALGRGRRLGIGVTLLFLAYFLYEAFLDVGNFTYFLDYFFTGDIPRLLTVLCFVTAALYLARLELVSIGRAAQYVLAGAVIFILLLALTSWKSFDPLNFYFRQSDGPDQVFAAVKGDLGRSECLVLLTFLLGRLPSEKSSGTVLGFIGARTLMLEVIFGLIAGVIGDYALVTKQPFFALSAYSGSSVAERLDAAFIFIWMTAGVLKLSVLLHCCGRCLTLISPRVSHFTGALAGAAAAAAAALMILIPRKWETLAYNDFIPWAVPLLCCAIPLICILFLRRRPVYEKLLLSPDP